MSDAYIYDALRTPRGRGLPGGALFEVKPIRLLVDCLEAMRRRLDLPQLPLETDDLIVGCALPTDDQGYNIARAALLQAGWETARGGIQINRFDASGLEAVNQAAARVATGWDDLILAGGLDSMSRVPYLTSNGPMVNDPQTIIDTHYIPQGVAADLVATLEHISREELDEFALRSHQRARTARDAGWFAPSLEHIRDRNGLIILDQDEWITGEVNREQLAAHEARYRELGSAGFDIMAMHRFPLVEYIDHRHTVGNSAQATDGAALALIGSEQKGKQFGLRPRAKVRSAALATVDAAVLGGGAVAAQMALEKAGLKEADVDLWEFNESFAANCISFQRTLAIPDDKFNVLGGSIALGHPLGATGLMLVCHVLDELERRDQTFGLLTINSGAGLAVATLLERVAP
ncbi:MAG: acetyl-CoA C-acyltransferase [Saprospiraceae bacterium]